MRSRRRCAICSTTSFSRVPPGPTAPGSSPPWPGSSATMTRRPVLFFAVSGASDGALAPPGLAAGAGVLSLSFSATTGAGGLLSAGLPGCRAIRWGIGLALGDQLAECRDQVYALNVDSKTGWFSDKKLPRLDFAVRLDGEPRVILGRPDAHGHDSGAARDVLHAKQQHHAAQLQGAAAVQGGARHASSSAPVGVWAVRVTARASSGSTSRCSSRSGCGRWGPAFSGHSTSL